MRTRDLAGTDLELPVVVFGAWALGGGYWGGRDDEAGVAAVRAGLEAGVSAIDTAPFYGQGHSERLVGRAVEGRRDEVLLLTKVGLRWDCEDGPLFFETRDEAGRPLRVHRNLRPASVRLEVERSLERLGTDRLDLVQVHWPDPTTPIAETLGALAALRSEGLVREIGVSNYSVPELEEARRALGDVPLASHQPKFNLVAREAERDVLSWGAAHGVGAIVYSPLEQGLLTGKVGPERTFGKGEGRRARPTFLAENRRRVNALLESAVRPVAEAHDATLAQVVLSWTIDRPGVTAAIAGARRPEQIAETASAGDLVLAPDESDAIDAAFAGLELVAE